MTIDINELREDKRPQSSTLVHALLDRLEAAEKERDDVAQQLVQSERGKRAISEECDALRNEIAYVKEVEFPRKAQAVADAWKGKCKRLEVERDILRAKIAEMEKQEPAGYGVRYVEPTNGEEDWDSIWKYRVFAEDHIKDFTQAYADVGEPVGASTVVPLYALPGAQPAPSVPEGFSREDLEAVADGLDGYEKTVNVGNVTGGGDDHLESTTAYAARFIRTMLAAAPEVKP